VKFHPVRTAVKVGLALALSVASTVTPSLFDALTPIDRVAAGCSQVREANGGPVVLVKIHDNPTVWETQFVTGTLRWECGDSHGKAY
jgi:hypothetical protein